MTYHSVRARLGRGHFQPQLLFYERTTGKGEGLSVGGSALSVGLGLSGEGQTGTEDSVGVGMDMGRSTGMGMGVSVGVDSVSDYLPVATSPATHDFPYSLSKAGSSPPLYQPYAPPSAYPPPRILPTYTTESEFSIHPAPSRKNNPTNTTNNWNVLPEPPPYQMPPTLQFPTPTQGHNRASNHHSPAPPPYSPPSYEESQSQRPSKPIAITPKEVKPTPVGIDHITPPPPARYPFLNPLSSESRGLAGVSFLPHGSLNYQTLNKHMTD